MFELSSFSYHPNFLRFDRAALTGDVIRFRRTDLVALMSVMAQPGSPACTVSTDGGDFASSALTQPGVYSFMLVIDGVQYPALVFCWPASIVQSRVFTHDGCVPRPDPEVAARRVLGSIAHHTVNTAGNSLFLATGYFPSALIGVTSADGLNPKLYGL